MREAPSRRAVSATSMATLPPPTTATRLPIDTPCPIATSRRNSHPQSTPSLSRPSRGIRADDEAPTARNTASCWALMSLMVRSFPTTVLPLKVTPMSMITLRSRPRRCSGNRYCGMPLSHHAAGSGKTVIQGHGVSQRGKVICGSETGRTGSHDADALASGLGTFLVL